MNNIKLIKILKKEKKSKDGSVKSQIKHHFRARKSKDNEPSNTLFKLDRSSVNQD